MTMKNGLLERKSIGVNELVSTQKERIENWHELILKKAEKMGEQDGAFNLPSQEDTQLSPNESVIKSEYQKLIADCWNIGKPYLDAPHLEYQSFSDKLKEIEENEDNIIEKEKAILEERKQNQLEEIHQSFKGRETELEQYESLVKRDYLLSKQNLHDAQIKVGRTTPLIHFKSKFWYIVLLLAIGISEVPLNLQIFQKFGEAFFITIIMASSLAISIPVLAHFTGVFLKQRKEKKEYFGIAVFCILLFVIFNFGVSIFRAYVLAENVAQESDNLNIVIFTSLNLILFVIGVLASYFRHDESYELENAHKDFQKEKKKYDKAQISIQNRQKLIANEKHSQTNQVHLTYEEELRRINNLRAGFIHRKQQAIQLYDEILNSFKSLEALIEANYQISIGKYRAANLRHRSNPQAPQPWASQEIPLSKAFSGCEELDPN